MAWGGRQRAMETAHHWDRLAKNQPAEITMFQISEVQVSPAFNGRLSFLTLRLLRIADRMLKGNATITKKTKTENPRLALPLKPKSRWAKRIRGSMKF
jgi:hypothetical protein